MWFSIIGGIIGGIMSGWISLFPESKKLQLLLFVGGVLLASILSGKDPRFLYRVFGLFIFYFVAALSMYLHTVIFKSNALFGWLALIYLSIFIIPSYFIIGFISNKVFKKIKGEK